MIVPVGDKDHAPCGGRHGITHRQAWRQGTLQTLDVALSVHEGPRPGGTPPAPLSTRLPVQDVAEVLGCLLRILRSSHRLGAWVWRESQDPGAGQTCVVYTDHDSLSLSSGGTVGPPRRAVVRIAVTPGLGAGVLNWLGACPRGLLGVGGERPGGAGSQDIALPDSQGDTVG